MNAAHIHLMVNHLPVWAVLSGLILVVLGHVRKSEELKSVGYVFWIAAGLAAGLAVGSGGRAELMVAELPGVSKKAILAHEEAAESALGILLCLSVLSAVLLFARLKLGKAGIWLGRAAVILGATALLYAGYVANIGGMIRHPEL